MAYSSNIRSSWSRSGDRQIASRSLSLEKVGPSEVPARSHRRRPSKRADPQLDTELLATAFSGGPVQVRRAQLDTRVSGRRFQPLSPRHSSTWRGSWQTSPAPNQSPTY